MAETNSLHVYAIQTPLIWESPEDNLDAFAHIINKTDVSKPGIIVLPEMFTSGFTMSPSGVSKSNSFILKWLKKQSLASGCAIAGSVAVEENGLFFNRLFFVTPKGNHAHYDKHHLFSLAGEEKIYQSGKEKVVVKWEGWNILLQVCYDLRFPAFSRNQLKNTYDLALYVANWPKVRSFAWQQLLVARAIENQCYVVGVNRTGQDGNAHEYEGASGIIDYSGKHLSGPNFEEFVVLSAMLQKESLYNFREKFGFLKDQDPFVTSQKDHSATPCKMVELD